MNDLQFYMGLLKIFGKYVNESVLDKDEQKIFDEMIHRADKTLEFYD